MGGRLYNPISATCMGRETGLATARGSGLTAAKQQQPGQVCTGSFSPGERQSLGF